MSTLTSTIAITGTINGRSINISHTYTNEDIIDAGVMSEEGVGQQHIATGGDASNNSYIQANPEYLAMVNKDAHGVTKMIMNTSGGDINFYLLPGTIAVLTSSPGTGIALATGTGTSIALGDLTNITSNPVTINGAVLMQGRVSSLAAFATTT